MGCCEELTHIYVWIWTWTCMCVCMFQAYCFTHSWQSINVAFLFPSSKWSLNWIMLACTHSFVKGSGGQQKVLCLKTVEYSVPKQNWFSLQQCGFGRTVFLRGTSHSWWGQRSEEHAYRGRQLSHERTASSFPQTF